MCLQLGSMAAHEGMTIFSPKTVYKNLQSNMYIHFEGNGPRFSKGSVTPRRLKAQHWARSLNLQILTQFLEYHSRSRVLQNLLESLLKHR